MLPKGGRVRSQKSFWSISYSRRIRPVPFTPLKGDSEHTMTAPDIAYG